MTSPEAKRIYTRKEVCRLIGVAESVLQKWESHGFIEQASEYSFRDLLALRTLCELRRNRFRVATIRKVIDALRKRLSDVSDPLVELKIFTDGRNIAVQVDGGRMEPLSGQLLLDFDRQEIRRLLQFPGRTARNTQTAEAAAKRLEAERWFDKGVEVEQTGGDIERAVAAYLKALESDPQLAGALVNLGTIYFHQRDWKRAQEYYERAVAVRPDYPLAQFNLGNLLDELGEWQQALEHYIKALSLDPAYADVHYNIALLYQSHSEPLKAVQHWRKYLKLDPSSYWAGIARCELSRLRAETILQGSKASSQ